MVTKRSHVLEQTCRFFQVCVTFLLPPGIKGLMILATFTKQVYFRHLAILTLVESIFWKVAGLLACDFGKNKHR